MTHRHGTSLALVAIIPVPVPRHNTWIMQLDGEKNWALGGGEYHVRPGRHSATVSYWGHGPVELCGSLGCIFDYRAELSIDFTTEAGHDYSIPAERREERDWIWVEDITTGKVVAGEKPPKAEKSTNGNEQGQAMTRKLTFPITSRQAPTAAKPYEMLYSDHYHPEVKRGVRAG